MDFAVSELQRKDDGKCSGGLLAVNNFQSQVKKNHADTSPLMTINLVQVTTDVPFRHSDRKEGSSEELSVP